MNTEAGDKGKGEEGRREDMKGRIKTKRARRGGNGKEEVRDRRKRLGDKLCKLQLSRFLGGQECGIVNF